MTNAQIKAQEALTRDRESAQRLSEARTREVEARERKIESAGGKEAPAAHARADVIKSADAMIGKDYPNMSKDDRTLMSRNVASQAAAIQRANKGISDDQALAQAYQAEINTGAAQRGSKEDGWKVLGIEVGGGKQKPDTYDRRGTPLQPLTLPAVNGKVDVSKLVEGKHYQVNGQIGRWNAAKKGFDVVGQ
jgi:hypothetical protein